MQPRDRRRMTGRCHKGTLLGFLLRATTAGGQSQNHNPQGCTLPKELRAVRRIQAKTNLGTMWLAMSRLPSPQRAHAGDRLVIDSACPIARAGLNLASQPSLSQPE